MKKKNIWKAIIFIAIVCASFSGLGFLFRPVWLSWNNYDTTEGLYAQPKNTIEVVALGTSTIVSGIAPMDLYEDYGICAYNLGREAGPMLTAYYWLKEAYKYHSESMKTVLVDASMISRGRSEDLYKKALLGMKFSKNKLCAAKDCTDTLDEFVAFINPLFAFHSRWKNLTELDFSIYNYKNESVRGYGLLTNALIDQKNANEIAVPLITEQADAGEKKLNDEAELYFKMMLGFCYEHDLKVVLVKAPGTGGWNHKEHNTIKKLAEECNVDFIDFNYAPYIDEIQYNEAVDSLDTNHMNYRGASKMTKWLGQYLVKNSNVTDVRRREKYAFMEKEAGEYKRVTYIKELREETDPVDYIMKAMEQKNFTIFMTVKENAATSLTQEQRDRFFDLGLSELAELEIRDSYLAVIEDGQIVCEKVKEYIEEGGLDNKTSSETVFDNDLENVEERIRAFFEENRGKVTLTSEEMCLSYEGKLKNGDVYSMKSGGYADGNLSSCIIRGKESSLNSRGMNIVVYDNNRRKVLDSVAFDLCKESVRDYPEAEKALEASVEEGKTPEELEGKEKELYLYNIKYNMESKRKKVRSKIDAEGLLTYLKAYMEKDYVLYLSAKDEASVALTDEARNALKEIGMTELSRLQVREPYLAVIADGVVAFEKKGLDQEVLEKKDTGYAVVSSGFNADNVSSIMIKGVEYSKNTRGINIVVCYKPTGSVVDSIVFDTHANPVAVN